MITNNRPLSHCHSNEKQLSQQLSGISVSHQRNTSNETTTMLPFTEVNSVQPERSRVHSQKKLTLAMKQTQQNYTISYSKQAYEGLRQQIKGGQGFGKSKFTSLKTINLPLDADNQQNKQLIHHESQQQLRNTNEFNDIINNLKLQIQKRLQQIAASAQLAIQQQNNRIQNLQMIIEKNNEEIIRKNTLIAELKARQSRSCSMEDKQYILQKMLDMQNKTKTLMKHLAGNKHLELKLDHLKEKVISMFGHKLTGLTLKVQKFIGQANQKFCKLESKMTMIESQRLQKQSERKQQIEQIDCKMQRLSDSVTRESLFSSYLDKFEDVEYSEDIGVGQEQFFFRSNLAISSQMQQMKDIVQARKDPLRCYIDYMGNIRYKDSDSVLLNKKGDPIVLNRQQISYFVTRKLIVLF